MNKKWIKISLKERIGEWRTAFNVFSFKFEVSQKNKFSEMRHDVWKVVCIKRQVGLLYIIEKNETYEIFNLMRLLRHNMYLYATIQILIALTILL